MKLKCQCCGIEREFPDDDDGDEAFKAGWDAPPWFSQVITCNLCPASCVMLGRSHANAHKHWEEHGRPEDWDIAVCAADDDWQ